MSHSNVALLALVIVASCGCYPSNVIDTQDRQVDPGSAAEVFAALEWAAATTEDLPGTYASVLIEGDIVSLVVEARYIFHVGGTYSGAALVLSPANPERLEYQTLNGTWSLDGDQLVLDDERAVIRRSGDFLRLEHAEGRIVLERYELP